MHVDEVELDNLKSFVPDLSKLSDVVDNNVVKTTVYDELVKKVNTIDSDEPNLENEVKYFNKRYLILIKLLWLKILIDWQK